jgi:hypothetical protein
MTKYASIAASHIFTPIAAETLCPLNIVTAEFLTELGSRVSAMSEDQWETTFLFQRLSVLIHATMRVQIVFRGTFAEDFETEG